MRSHLRTLTIWKYRAHKWRRVCSFLVPKREPRYTTLFTRGENPLSMLLLYTWWHEKKTTKSPCALPKTPLNVLLSTVVSGLWFTQQHQVHAQGPEILPNSLFQVSLHIGTTRSSIRWGKKKRVWSSYLIFNRTLQYPQASSAKTRLLAASTESKFCRLQICGRFPQPWSPSALPAGRPWSVLCKVRGHVSFKTRPSCTLLLYMNSGASADKSYGSIVGWGKEKTGCWAGNSEVSCWLVTLI